MNSANSNQILFELPVPANWNPESQKALVSEITGWLSAMHFNIRLAEQYGNSLFFSQKSEARFFQKATIVPDDQLLLMVTAANSKVYPHPIEKISLIFTDFFIRQISHKWDSESVLSAKMSDLIEKVVPKADVRTLEISTIGFPLVSLSLNGTGKPFQHSREILIMDGNLSDAETIYQIERLFFSDFHVARQWSGAVDLATGKVKSFSNGLVRPDAQTVQLEHGRKIKISPPVVLVTEYSSIERGTAKLYLLINTEGIRAVSDGHPFWNMAVSSLLRNSRRFVISATSELTLRADVKSTVRLGSPLQNGPELEPQIRELLRSLGGPKNDRFGARRRVTTFGH
ncbi:MAG: hypothetical protein WCT31_04940 [Candidatus Micrarchaeia archaeon]|jgi:hypothetical protein